jgi:hypothetical protein
MLAGVAGSWRQSHRPGRLDVALLAAVGLVTGFGFGAVMDVWNWTFYAGSGQLGWSPQLAPLAALGRFGRYYLLTSLGYDSFRAGGNALMVVLLGLPVLVGLQRVVRRLHLNWPGPLEAASAQPLHHQAARELVVPRLAAGVDGGPPEADQAGRQVQ